MLPIVLDWYKPRSGVEVLSDAGDGQGEIIQATMGVEPISYHHTNLENPICVQFMNCTSRDDLVVFANRFGVTRGHMNDLRPFRIPMNIMQYHQGCVDELLRLTLRREGVAGSANFLLDKVSLSPRFEHDEDEGRRRLSLRPRDLLSFMEIEAAFAIDAGAKITQCAHCGKYYLTGPMTGRRSSATYCSDRCRVAAMRMRNKLG